jgi:adenine-specific DNA-methyltransferase
MHEVWHGESQHRAVDLPDGINCVITDPPYGVDFVSNSARRGASFEKYNNAIDNDGDPETAIENFMEVMNIIIPKLAENADIYIFTMWTVYPEWKTAVDLLGLEVKQLLVWEKGYPGMGDLEHNWGCGHELIIYAKKGNRPVAYRRRAVITIDRVPGGKNIHPTEKPVSLLEMLIEMSTDPGDLVVDPYAGSGSTIWAAQRTGRLGIGIEMNQNYAEAANERLSQVGFTFDYEE